MASTTGTRSVTPPKNGWARLSDTDRTCRRAAERMFDAQVVAEAYSPRVFDHFADKQKTMGFVVATVLSAMLDQVLAAVVAARKRLTTDLGISVPDPDLLLSPNHEQALNHIALWRVAQLWYGPMSKAHNAMFEKVHASLTAQVQADPTVFDSLPVALCFNECMREYAAAGGNSTVFMPTTARKYMTNASPLLDDPLAAYCLLEASHDATTYLHLSARLRNSLRLNFHLVVLAGDEVLSLVPEHVYSDRKVSAWILEAREMHYEANPKRTPWLTILSVLPKLVFGRGHLNLCDVKAWRAQE